MLYRLGFTLTVKFIRWFYAWIDRYRLNRALPLTRGLMIFLSVVPPTWAIPMPFRGRCPGAF